MAMLRWSLGKGRRLSHSSAATEFDAPPEERVQERNGERVLVVGFDFGYFKVCDYLSSFAACVGVGAINL